MEINAKIEQRIIVKFLVKSGKTNNEIRQMLSAVYGEGTLSRSTLFEWIGRFREGREDVLDDERRGRPRTARQPAVVAKIESKMNEDRRRTIREVAGSVGVSRESVRRILHDELGMNKVSPHLVPRVLTLEQKETRVRVCEEWLQADAEEDIFSRVITGDESWIFEYDLVKKRADMVWLSPDEPRPKKARMSKSNVKVMLTLFFDSKGILLLDWVPKGETVTGLSYIETLKRLRERIRKKRPTLFQDYDWFLHHDNAPAHRSFVVQRFLTKNAVSVLEHPAYSPDLAPSDFFAFDRLKDHIRGVRFESVEEIKLTAARVLKEIPESDWKKCYESWKKRMHRCIAAGGEYFEGDKCYDSEI